MQGRTFKDGGKVGLKGVKKLAGSNTVDERVIFYVCFLSFEKGRADVFEDSHIGVWRS